MACRPTAGLPIVTGSSEGGHVSYLMASQQSGIVGGAVALLGYIPPGVWNPQMSPTVGLHATADSTVPYERTRAYWDAMKSAGAQLSTQIFPGGHSVSDAMGAAWRSAVSNFVAEQA